MIIINENNSGLESNALKKMKQKTRLYTVNLASKLI